VSAFFCQEITIEDILYQMINATKLRVDFEGNIGEILVLFLWKVRFLKLHMDGVDTHVDISDALQCQ